MDYLFTIVKLMQGRNRQGLLNLDQTNAPIKLSCIDLKNSINTLAQGPSPKSLTIQSSYPMHMTFCLFRSNYKFYK